MSSLKDGGSRVSIAEDTYVFVDLRPQLAGDLRAARVSSLSSSGFVEVDSGANQGKRAWHRDWPSCTPLSVNVAR
jgi:hypothetical protein